MNGQNRPVWETEVISYGYSNSLPMNDSGFIPIGGDMGERFEDFEVSEIPAYSPSGTGEHLYLWIEKKGRSTQDLVKVIGKVFGVRETEIGTAGKKDAHAVTRQWISVCTKDNAQAIESLQKFSWLRLLRVSRHTNKLRMGHLIGNHFKIRLNGVTASDEAISKACTELSNDGFINYFGRQRFGIDKKNIQEGIRIMNGGNARHQMKLMYISALQSALFNLATARRFLEMHFKPTEGDVLKKINAGCFICDDPVTDSERAMKGEIAVTLALPGKKVMHGHGYAETLQENAFRDFQAFWENELSPPPDFSRFNSLADGDRRIICVRPNDLTWNRSDKDSIDVEFSLPSGCYATVLLRHLCGISFSR